MSKSTPTYNSWSSMKKRVNQKSSVGRYVDVTLDPRWEVFSNFVADMGERPPGHTLDRIDSTQGYCKANCRWATPSQQSANRRNCIYVEYKGQVYALKHLCQRLNLPYKGVHYRVRYMGENPLDAIRHFQNVQTKRSSDRLRNGATVRRTKR